MFKLSFFVTFNIILSIDDYQLHIVSKCIDPNIVRLTLPPDSYK